MLQALRHAVRVLLEAKGRTAVVPVSLALGIGIWMSLAALPEGEGET